MKSSPSILKLILLTFSVLICNFAGNTNSAVYKGNSPYRQFMSYYFSYSSDINHSGPDRLLVDESSESIHEEEVDENHYRFHFKDVQQGNSDTDKMSSLSSQSSVLSVQNDSCTFYGGFKYEEEEDYDFFSKQCDMYQTSLICYPPKPNVHGIYYHQSQCDCFRWTEIKKETKVQAAIFAENDVIVKGLLIDLADFLSIEMEWDEESGQCTAKTGSACLVPVTNNNNNTSSSSTTTEFPSTAQNNNTTNINDKQEFVHVTCSRGLECREINDDGFIIGRCSPTN